MQSLAILVAFIKITGQFSLFLYALEEFDELWNYLSLDDLKETMEFSWTTSSATSIVISLFRFFIFFLGRFW